MIINDSRILQNDGKVFKSQAVSSYLQTCRTDTYTYCITLDGVSANDPFKFYLETPTVMNKIIHETNGTTLNGISATGVGYKNIYTFGNTDAVILYSSPQVAYEKGDLFGFMNQFPNLETVCFATSVFNCNISYNSLPPKLKKFYVYDTTITGDISTLNNTENLENLTLLNSLLCGDYNNMNLTKLKCFNMQFSWNMEGNFDQLFNANPDLIDIIFYPNGNTPVNYSNIDVSNLTSFSHYDGINYANVTGDITNWIFNTGLTYFNMGTYSCITGDITNWDISNTLLMNFTINDFNFNSITGNLSGWTFNDTTAQLSLIGLGITALPDFPETMTNQIHIEGCNNITEDINTIVFPTGLTYLLMGNNSLTGDIGNFTIPSEVLLFSMYGNEITGDFSGITFNDNVVLILLSDNPITGSIVGVSIPNSLATLILDTTNMYIDFDAGTFDTKNLNFFSLSNISGITGNLANLIITGNSLQDLVINSTPIDSDLSNLSLDVITNLQIVDANPIYGDISNWVTGTTSLDSLQIGYNPNLSGDTSNWNVSGVTTLGLQNDIGLYGALKHNDPYLLVLAGTNISSNIETDFDFTNRASDIRLNNTEIVGNLSGVTLYSGIFRFFITNCSNIFGSNAFIDYLFVNKKYFTSTNGFFIEMNNIGDTVTGASETLGDLGTWGGSQWDLTEEQVNNLAAGTDYDGLGTNTPWNSKQKIYWMVNAQTSSTNPTKRYINYYIIY